MRAKYVVVGGGVMGTSIARELAFGSDPLDRPVVLLERRDLGSGSSGRSGAILRALYADRELSAMARDSMREYASFHTRTGRSIGYRRTGVLTLAGPQVPEWPPRLAEYVAGMQDLGIEVELCDAAALRELIPGLAIVEETVGVWEPDGGTVHPMRALDAFAAMARSYGCVTRAGEEVREVEVRDGRARAVVTESGRFECDAVVLAAGPWTQRLLAGLGCELPLSVVRPENHFLSMPGGYEVDSSGGVFELLGTDAIPGLEDPIARAEASERHRHRDDVAPAHPVVIDLEYGLYVRCDPTYERTRIGSISYAADRVLDDPDQLGDDIDEAAATESRESLRRRLPTYRDQSDQGSLAAWYTLTPDARPVLGPVPGIEGLFVVAGFSGHGFKLAPSVGLGIAQMVRGEPISAFDVDFFSPTRFADASGDGRVKAFGL